MSSAAATARPDVFILAAGRGRRLIPLTDATPKPLLEVGGKPLLAHHLAALAGRGFGGAVINLAWHGAQIRDYLADDANRCGLDIRFADEPPGALETGGGVVNALPLLRGDSFVVVNADVLCDVDLAALSVGDDCDMNLVLVATPGYREHGDFGLVGGRLRLRGGGGGYGDGDGDGGDGNAGNRNAGGGGDGDNDDNDGDNDDGGGGGGGDGDGDGNRNAGGGGGDDGEYTYAGIGIFRRRAFDGFAAGRFPLLAVIERAIERGRAGGVVHRGLWMDVGAPERLVEARRYFGDSEE